MDRDPSWQLGAPIADLQRVIKRSRNLPFIQVMIERPVLGGKLSLSAPSGILADTFARLLSGDPHLRM